MTTYKHTERDVEPVTPYRDNSVELEELARQHSMSRSWLPFLGGTVPLFLCVITLITSPFVVAYILLAPKFAALWAGLP